MAHLLAPNLNSDEYYQILGVARSATDAQIRKAYMKLAFKWHPDKNPGDEEATINFQKINEANATLSDKEKRKTYDTNLKEAADQYESENMPRGHPMEPHDIFVGIAAGSIVHLKGLVSEPEKNGARGQVKGYDPTSGRYVVQIASSDETLRVKPSNLLQQVKVTLHGLERIRMAELNGSEADIIWQDDVRGSYLVMVTSIENFMCLKPSNFILPKGTLGQITGLQSKPELNGTWGTIKGFDSQSGGRYDVQLSAEKTIRLKMINIRL